MTPTPRDEALPFPRARNEFHFDKCPQVGEYRLRVKVGARLPEGLAYPRLRIQVGASRGTGVLTTIAEVDVTAPLDKPQTLTLRGYLDDLPIPVAGTRDASQLMFDMRVDEATVALLGAEDRVKKGANDQKAIQARLENPKLPFLRIESVEFEVPYNESWPPQSHERIFFDSPRRDDEDAYARELIERFVSRAYRRPATAADVELVMGFYRKVRPSARSLVEAMRETLPLVLISPHFLYLTEPRGESDKKERLTDHELASRLSYFLWSTMPDDRLLALARAGKLRDPGTLKAETLRLLADPRSRQFVDRFSLQWLGLTNVERTSISSTHFPNFNTTLKRDMLGETRHFFGYLVDHNLSCLNLLDADFTVINRMLAEHYGLAGPRGSAFEYVKLRPEDRRGGVLSQASFLLAGSDGGESHPIKRGTLLLGRLLNSPPPSPPADVPDLSSQGPAVASLSLRKRLELHNRKVSCNNCHQKIDPWGVALENYDAVGLWRERIAPPPSTGAKPAPGVPVEAQANLPSGITVADAVALKKHLATHERDRFARAFTRKLLSYAVGRTADAGDQDTLDALSRQLAENDYRLRGFIVAIVGNEVFQHK